LKNSPAVPVVFITNEMANCCNPHNHTILQTELLDSWVTNTPVKMLCS